MHELYHFGFYLVAPQKFLFFPCNGERERESVKYKRLIYNSRFFPLSFLLFLSMEIGVGIETLDGSMVNPMVSWITSSSLGASLVDHLSTIRFHAILCLLFFSHPPPNPRISTGLWLDCFAARNHVWRGGRSFNGEGRDRGLAHLHGGSCVFRDFFNCQCGTRVGILGSMVEMSLNEWESRENLSESVGESCHPAFIHFIHIFFEYFRVWN